MTAPTPTEQRMAMAREVALTLRKIMVGVPEGVMLEATTILMQALFVSGVKPEHRLALFSRVTKQMRDDILMNFDSEAIEDRQSNLLNKWFEDTEGMCGIEKTKTMLEGKVGLAAAILEARK